jgi:predicted transposase YbfD/YdcC
MSITEIFQSVSDPRSHRNREYNLETILGITLLGGLTGIDSFSGLGDYAEAHYDSLKQYFILPDTAPSHDTFQRILGAINPTEFYNSFSAFTKKLATIKSEIISLDGKTIRNSANNKINKSNGNNNPLHIVSAWCQKNQLVLAQHKVREKSNEITAIPEVLKLLDLNGRIITIDAMGCQRDICQQIIDKEGDYLIAIKGNQKTLFEDIKEYFSDEQLLSNCNNWSEYDKGSGRLEERHCFVTSEVDWLQKHHNWPGLKSIAIVKSKRTKKDKITNEMRYYISSMPANAEIFCKAARSHWGIENSLHWRLDVVFNEDKSCITNDNAAENMDIVRKWALNILQKAKDKPDQSIRGLQRKSAMSFKHLVKVIDKIFHA